MIVPTKGIRPQIALLTVGGEIISELTEPMTVSRLWSCLRMSRTARNDSQIGFDWFVLALDLAFSLGTIQLTEDGFLTRLAR
jgi:hypothetical protein